MLISQLAVGNEDAAGKTVRIRARDIICHSAKCNFIFGRKSKQGTGNNGTYARAYLEKASLE
jgi:hypothetical protein